jgi:hypothetical protein
MDKPSCSNCPYGLQTTARDGKAYQCRIDAPKVSPLPNGLQTTAGWPVVDADELCGRHPLHPGQRDRIAEMAMQGLLAFYGLKAPEEEDIALWSYNLADAMMAERAKGMT